MSHVPNVSMSNQTSSIGVNPVYQTTEDVPPLTTTQRTGLQIQREADSPGWNAGASDSTPPPGSVPGEALPPQRSDRYAGTLPRL